MGTKYQNLKFINYNWPDNAVDPVVVSLILPDGSEELVGSICTDFSDGEESPTFLSIDAQGKELFPPTKNYYTADSQFETYALHLIQASRTKEGKTKETRQQARAEEIQGVRMSKSQKENSKSINR